VVDDVGERLLERGFRGHRSPEWRWRIRLNNRTERPD
jgi:hypothetical protein